MSTVDITLVVSTSVQGHEGIQSRGTTLPVDEQAARDLFARGWATPAAAPRSRAKRD